MVWGVFSGNNGRWGLFFLSKNVTLDGGNYLEILEQHMLPIWDIHKCHDFLYDGAPPRKSKLVMKLQEDREIRIWERPGNVPYLNLIENSWTFIKNNVQENHPASITDLNEMLTDLWVDMNLFILLNCHNPC